MKTRLTFLCALSVSLRLLAAEADSGLVAHEWGTFTTVQGADGVQVAWNPFIRTDLPGFVYNRGHARSFGWTLSGYDVKGDMLTIARMETPVIYFYSPTERTVDVTVNFPQGRITEWYPQATQLGPYVTSDAANKEKAARSFIEWKGVQILPANTTEISEEKLIREKGENHYYSARETDANFLRVPAMRGGAEYERDLFYRGAGNFKAPLTLNLTESESSLRLSTQNPEPLTDVFVLTIRQGLARFQYVERVAPGSEQTVKMDSGAFAPLSDVRTRLMRDMAHALARQGLYAREADAMVNTWKEQWFADEGVRVLYVLPRAWTDRVLPLTISPSPKQIERVMVGRSELIVPSVEQQFRREIAKYQAGDAPARVRAVKEVQKLGLGRFVEPATRMVLFGNNDKDQIKAAWDVARLASNGEVTQPAGPEKTTAAVAPESKKTVSLTSHRVAN